MDILQETGPWFNKKMSSYQYRKSHYGDKTILRPSYLHNGRAAYPSAKLCVHNIQSVCKILTLCVQFSDDMTTTQ